MANMSTAPQLHQPQMEHEQAKASIELIERGKEPNDSGQIEVTEVDVSLRVVKGR